MRILALDYGTKRIGVAVSDELEMLARDLSVLNLKSFWKEIKGIVESSGVGLVVVGLPLGLNGEKTAKTIEVEKFAEKLKKKVVCPVEMFDERLSTVMAKKLTNFEKIVDSIAAKIILQNYLDAKKNKRK